jgi:hypothetical protein
MLDNPGTNEHKTAARSDTGTDAGSGQASLQAPAISLPKGGVAIRGIGEKFGTDPATGAGSMSVPIAASPGRLRPSAVAHLRLRRGQRHVRAGVEPRTPAITRKTPRYRLTITHPP